jgi:hypothetical protein
LPARSRTPAIALFDGMGFRTTVDAAGATMVQLELEPA